MEKFRKSQIRRVLIRKTNALVADFECNFLLKPTLAQSGFQEQQIAYYTLDTDVA